MLDKNIKYSKETVEALTELAYCLRKIDSRMKKEGYEIVDGVIQEI